MKTSNKLTEKASVRKKGKSYFKQAQARKFVYLIISKTFVDLKIEFLSFKFILKFKKSIKSSQHNHPHEKHFLSLLCTRTLFHKKFTLSNINALHRSGRL